MNKNMINYAFSHESDALSITQDNNLEVIGLMLEKHIYLILFKSFKIIQFHCLGIVLVFNVSN